MSNPFDPNAEYTQTFTYESNGYGPRRVSSPRRQTKINWMPVILMLVVLAPIVYFILH